MYKVLIVDDEPFILDGLPYVIDWEEHGAEIAASARSGEDALRILERQTIHIVITDIKMPGMTGLELIETARNRGHSVKFIVLSGYDEFELVKKAVIYGVENYLLKPVEEEELSDTLLTTIEKLDHEVNLSIQHKQNYSIVKENILYRWVSGQIGQEELVNRAEFLHIDLAFEHFQVGVVHLVARPGTAAGSHSIQSESSGTAAGRPDAALCYAILNVCGETISGFANCLPFSGINGVPILLFAWNDGDAHHERLLAELLERCAENVSKYLKLEIAISLGTVERDYRHVQHSYRAACSKQAQSGQAAGTAGSSALSGLAGLSGPSVLSGSAGLHGSSALSGLAGSYGASASIAEDVHPAVMKVIAYIDEHYSQEMSLKTLSHQFNMNAAYLGQLFKKATADMFSNYLNRVRIEKAKRLLAESELKASEIAAAVGFSNLQYFSNVFFKYTGFYPTDFKKQQAGERNGNRFPV